MKPLRTIGLCAIILEPLFFLTGCGDEKQPAKQEQTQTAVGNQPIPKGDAGRRLLFEKRCQEGYFGMCGELGLMWEHGWGGKKDKTKADEYYKKACEGGVPKSCEAIGKKLTPEEQLKVYDKNCSKGNGFSCNNLGHMLLGGMGVPKDVTKAVAALDKACSADYAASCFTLEKMLSAGKEVPEDKERAAKIMEKAKAAVQKEEALQVKYLGAPSRDKLPLVKPSDKFFKQLTSTGQADDKKDGHNH